MQRLLSVWLLISVFISGCGSSNQAVFEIAGQTMGTTYRLTYTAGENLNGELSDQTTRLLDEINESLSPFIESSLITRINSSRDTTETHAVDYHFGTVFKHARKIHDLTDGAFNPALGPLIRAWGFGKDDSQSLDSTRIDELLQLSSLDVFVLDEANPPRLRKRLSEAELDFGAIAKGYAVDELGRLLESGGVTDYLVEIGGEVRARGRHPEKRSWRVGIEKPLEASRDFQVIVQLSDISMATSGNYRNFFWKDGRKVVHTINPFTGYPEDNSLLSVSVVARDCMTADAFATAFMVLGIDATLDLIERNGGPDVYLISGGDETALETSISEGFSRIIVADADR